MNKLSKMKNAELYRDYWSERVLILIQAEYDNNIDMIQAAIKNQKQISGGVTGKAQNQLAMSKQVIIVNNIENLNP